MRQTYAGTLFCLIMGCVFVAPSCGAQENPPLPNTAGSQPPGLTLKPSRTVQFSTDEGTWLSLDVSPHGQSIIFDLAGHLYVLPAAGGEAKAITSLAASFKSTRSIIAVRLLKSARKRPITSAARLPSQPLPALRAWNPRYAASQSRSASR